MERKCDICEGRRFKTLFPIEDGLVLKCGGCGLVILELTDKGRAALEASYEREFFDEREDYFFKDGIVDGTGEEKAHILDFRDGLSRISAYKKPPGELLDVGCAVGSFLQIAKGSKWNCQGVEVSKYAASHAEKRLGIPVFGGTLKEARYEDNHFDVVTMWDILEHLGDPMVQMQEVRRILKPGGILLVNTPNEASLLRVTARFIRSASAGLSKGAVERLYHRYHLCYYNEQAASMLLERAGFTILNVVKKPIPSTRGRGSKLVRTMVSGFSRIETLFNTGYELFFIARKN